MDNLVLYKVTYSDLRQQSAKDLTKLDFYGYAIGGLAVGEGQKLMLQTLDNTTIHMQDNKPRYLMGVGKPGRYNWCS